MIAYVEHFTILGPVAEKSQSRIVSNHIATRLKLFPSYFYVCGCKFEHSNKKTLKIAK